MLCLVYRLIQLFRGLLDKLLVFRYIVLELDRWLLPDETDHLRKWEWQLSFHSLQTAKAWCACLRVSLVGFGDPGLLWAAALQSLLSLTTITLFLALLRSRPLPQLHHSRSGGSSSPQRILSYTTLVIVLSEQSSIRLLCYGGAHRGARRALGGKVDVLGPPANFDIVVVGVELPLAPVVEHFEDVLVRIRGEVHAAFKIIVVY